MYTWLVCLSECHHDDRLTALLLVHILFTGHQGMRQYVPDLISCCIVCDVALINPIQMVPHFGQDMVLYAFFSLRIECSGLGVKRDTPCNAL